ncbi:MAG: helix-turn-helix transcriptional regulator [Magnetococcales bacterium]|nr:helix-turn-helix transcriptional regulator [Magnetococcales bacterium]
MSESNAGEGSTPPTMTNSLGWRIRHARHRGGFSQKELAEKVGISQTAIYKLEMGQTAHSQIKLAIAQACGVNPDWLDSGAGRPEPAAVANPVAAEPAAAEAGLPAPIAVATPNPLPQGPRDTLGQRVYLARKRVRLTQQQLAERIGTRQSAIQKLENGVIRRSRMLIPLAQVCGVDPIWLETGQGHPFPTGGEAAAGAEQSQALPANGSPAAPPENSGGTGQVEPGSWKPFILPLVARFHDCPSQTNLARVEEILRDYQRLWIESRSGHPSRPEGPLGQRIAWLGD